MTLAYANYIIKLPTDSSVEGREIMCPRKRLSQEERKIEIVEAAILLFKEKGFVYTTMEDIVSATSLSKGGVYHYYKNTTDILHDIMYMGMEYRLAIIRDTAKEARKGEELDFAARKILEKILDDNRYMEIYVQFLMAKKNNPKLEKLFEELKENSRVELQKELGGIYEITEDEDKFDMLTNFMNSMIMGAEILSCRENFKNNRNILFEVLKVLLRK